ncbi:UPF0149 family protein [Cupriavidus sp. IK-TO18]|uniref:UPF0149 family protein n=1 Tax=Cupriavidus sp. IK-TO18 TaxID=2782182 RepID=UPI001897F48F|nr:UPF0149 family protein [Cupriavidus sp. IK-TO18]MBF6990787.1 UPF0149 family protein [Cupriavidus sp. IK-TO18]
MSQIFSQPPTLEELSQLATGLDAIGAMNLEMLDGYFTALICGPDKVTPSDYLPEVWGNKYSAYTDELATAILRLLMRHWNAIAMRLQSGLNSPNAYLPILLDRDHGGARGNDWAHGFIQGVQISLESWNRLFNDEDHCGLIAAIMILHYEHDPDPGMRPPRIPPEKREELLGLMIHSVPLIYRYFEPYRKALASPVSTSLLQSERFYVPCPCGSGRDRELCCLGLTRTLH